MVIRPTDEEFARYAAKHALHPDGKPQQPERLEPLRSQGVTDEKTLADHTLNVMQANDTKCFRGAYGREVYANDRMNTIVVTNELKPDRSSVYHNDDSTRTATQRLEESAKREQTTYRVPCDIRTGGSAALEADRIARPVDDRAQIQPDAGPNKPEPPEPTKPGASVPPPRETEESASAAKPGLDLTKVDLPKYAEAEHGYTVRPRAEGMCHLEKGGERLRAQQDDQGSWSYENPRKDNDSGTITDFAIRRGGSEAGIADYLKRNPDEAKKAQEAQKAAEDARAKAAEQAATRKPDGRGE